MVLKRIIRQYLNQHFPENLRPTQKLDRKSAKIIENQNYFNDTPLIVRTERADRKLEKSRVFPLIPSTNGMEYEYSGNLLKIQHDPFFKEIQRSSTFTHSLETSTIHYQTKLCKDFFINSITHNVNKNIKSSNQWTGLDINRLTSRTKEYNVWKTRKSLYSLNQYKSALGNKNRRNRSSVYKSQLRERKKLAILYGNLSKKEIYRTIQRAEKYRGALRDNIFRVLESRLDVILYRVGFFKSIPTARQWIVHRKILVNQQLVTIAHYQVKAGDVVSVDPRYACLVIEMINSRFQEIKEFTSNLEQLAGLSEEQLPDFFSWAADLFEADKKHVSDKQLAALFAEQEQEQEKSTTRQTAGISAEQQVAALALLIKLVAPSRSYIARCRIVEKMNKYGILYILKKILFKARDKILKERKKKLKEKSEEMDEKYEQVATNWLRYFEMIKEMIKELLKMKIIADMAKKEYGLKIRDPLFNYKRDLLFDRLREKENDKQNFFSIDENDVKKPLHLEISYKTLTAVYLYSPQKLFFPVNIDIDAVKKSYY